MQALEPNTWIKHREDTLQQVRKILGLDKPGRLDEAIDILQDWAKKQPHFNQKEFDRNYLERCIIRSKGSVEKSKQHLENMCILKTITRQFFDNSSKPNELATDNIEEALMPRQTSDFCSIFLLRSRHREDYWEDLVYRCYCRGANNFEYWYAYDYNLGYITIFDLRDSNLFKLVKMLGTPVVRTTLLAIFKYFGSRIRSIHLLTESKLVHSLAAVIKPFLRKQAQKLHIHKTCEEMYSYVDKDLLPSDYGGKEETLSVLSKKMLDYLSTDEVQNKFKITKRYTINTEIKRLPQNLDDDIDDLDTFKTLTLD